MSEHEPNQEDVTAQEIIEKLGDLLSEDDRDYLTYALEGEDDPIIRFHTVYTYAMFALLERGEDAEAVLRARGVLQDEA